MSRVEFGPLQRGLVALLLFTASEWAAWVAVLVHAFAQGGARLAMLATLAQLAAAAVTAPFGTAALSRLEPRRALRRAFVLQALASLALAGALALDAAPAAIVALAAVLTALVSLGRPSYYALLARAVSDASARTRWNGLSTATEGVAILAGPALAGLLLVAGSAAAVLAGCALALLLAWACLAAVPGVGAPTWPMARRQRGAARAALRAGWRMLGAARGPRVLVAAVAGGFFLAGAIDVLAVVFASDTLRLGADAPGALISALGAGSVLGAGALALGGALVRARLLLPAGVLITSAPFALAASSHDLLTAVAWLALAGAGKGALDVLCRTELQERLAGRRLVAAFGCQECLAHAALALGATAALPLVTTLGARGAFVVVAGALPALCGLALCGQSSAAGARARSLARLVAR